MKAGAREYLVKPFDTDELSNTIRRTYQLEQQRMGTIENISGNKGQQKIDPQVVTVFGTKGGVGKTTISVNMAAQLTKRTKKKVVLVDLDLQFGDVSVFLNIVPKKTIAELVQERGKLTIDLIESYLIPHISGIKILPAPLRPELAELITPDHILEILAILRR
ncbi:MAG: AAA family ATPase, partial [Clostridia bacterium]|nr:AAA family ATPase [Clostridia bacterium]